MVILERALNGIENNVLQAYAWQYIDFKKEVLMLKLKQGIALPRVIEISYRIEVSNEAELLMVQSQVKHECEMRLLNCEFSYEGI